MFDFTIKSFKKYNNIKELHIDNKFNIYYYGFDCEDLELYWNLQIDKEETMIKQCGRLKPLKIEKCFHCFRTGDKETNISALVFKSGGNFICLYVDASIYFPVHYKNFEETRRKINNDDLFVKMLLL